MEDPAHSQDTAQLTPRIRTKGFGDTEPPLQAQKGLAKGTLLLPQRLLDPKSIYCTTPYLETENGAGDT